MVLGRYDFMGDIMSATIHRINISKLTSGT